MRRLPLFLIPLFLPLVSFATKLTVPIPTGSGSSVGDVTSFGQYIEKIYTFGIVLGAFFAVGTVVYAGIKFVVSQGNSGQIGEARSMIIQSLWGILLLLSAYLILSFINPELTKIDFSQGGVKTIAEQHGFTITDPPANSSSATATQRPLAVSYRSNYGARAASAGGEISAFNNLKSEIQRLSQAYVGGATTLADSRKALQSLKDDIDIYFDTDLRSRLQAASPKTPADQIERQARAARDSFYTDPSGSNSALDLFPPSGNGTKGAEFRSELRKIFLP